MWKEKLLHLLRRASSDPPPDTQEAMRRGQDKNRAHPPRDSGDGDATAHGKARTMKRRGSRRFFRGFLFAAFCGVTGLIAAIWAADAAVARAGRGRCFDDAAKIPAQEVALVLGTSPFMANGQENLHYRNRIEAAAALYKAGKAKYLLVSGDNGRRVYDEPSAMRNDLIARSVPAERIVCDYAGFRTLDSLVRAKKVFGLTGCTIVSQRFHNERALYLADATGLPALAFDAADPPGGSGPRLWWRERFSRLTAVLDVNVWNRQPKFLGPPVQVGSGQWSVVSGQLGASAGDKPPSLRVSN